MSLRKIDPLDVLKELRRLEAGKPTRLPPAAIAFLALGLLEAGGTAPARRLGDSLQFLQRLHALPDTRPPQVS